MASVMLGGNGRLGQTRRVATEKASGVKARPITVRITIGCENPIGISRGRMSREKGRVPVGTLGTATGFVHSQTKL